MIKFNCKRREIQDWASFIGVILVDIIYDFNSLFSRRQFFQNNRLRIPLATCSRVLRLADWLAPATRGRSSPRLSRSSGSSSRAPATTGSSWKTRASCTKWIRPFNILKLMGRRKTRRNRGKHLWIFFCEKHQSKNVLLSERNVWF